jgi:hypothetical protein
MECRREEFEDGGRGAEQRDSRREHRLGRMRAAAR